MSDNCYRGALGLLRKRWLEKAEARMEADPEYQRKYAEIVEKYGENSWELFKLRLDNNYMDNRPWYWQVYWQKQRIIARLYEMKFYIRRYLLRIHKPNGYWHYLHSGVLICPDCDYEGKGCRENCANHACVSRLLSTEDVHANVSEGYLVTAECMNCGVPCP